MRYVAQKYDSNCFAVALKNCAVYLGIKFDVNRFIRLAGRAKVGGGLAKSLIQLSKLPLEETNDINNVFENGGIITIMHPLINLHSTFCVPMKDKDKVMLINSWIGCNEMPIYKNDLNQFLPKYPNNRMYYIDN